MAQSNNPADPANQEQLPIEVRAFCLLCKAPTSITVGKHRGITVYELVVPNGWLLVHETGRNPMAVFLVCPTCLPRYVDLLPACCPCPE